MSDIKPFNLRKKASEDSFFMRDDEEGDDISSFNPMQTGGFTAQELDAFEQFAQSSGIRNSRQLGQLNQQIEIINSQLIEGSVSHEAATQKVYQWIRSNASQQVAIPQYQQPQSQPMAPQEQQSSSQEQPVAEEEFEKYEQEPEEFPQEGKKDEDVEIEEQNNRLKQVMENESLPPVVSEYSIKNDIVTNVIDKSHNSISKKSKIYATKQSAIFQKNFLSGQLWDQKYFQKFQNLAGYTAGKINKRNMDRGIYERVTPEDEFGVTFTALHCALGVAERADKKVDNSKTRVDNRLAIFTFNEDLIKPEIRDSEQWRRAKTNWMQELERRQQEVTIDNNRIFAAAGVSDLQSYLAKHGVSAIKNLPAGVERPREVQKDLYAPTKVSYILREKGLPESLLGNLNELIEQGANGLQGEAFADTVFKRAWSIAVHERTYQERDKARQAVEVSSDDGDSTSIMENVDQENMSSISDQRADEAPDSLEDNKKAFEVRTGIVKGFMNDVWSGLRASINEIKDPAERADKWNKFEKILLKTTMFDYQSDFFANADPAQKVQFEQQEEVDPLTKKKKKKKLKRKLTGKEWSTTDNGRVINNEFGKIGYPISEEESDSWTVKTENGKGFESRQAHSGLKSIVGREGFFNGYVKLLNLKNDIISAAQGLNVDPANPNIEAIKQVILSKNPEAVHPILKKFWEDPVFFSITLQEDRAALQHLYEKAKNEVYNPSTLDNEMNIIWPHLSSDALMTVCKRIKEYRDNPPKTEEGKVKFEQDLAIARQSFINVIGIHPSVKDETPGEGGEQKYKNKGLDRKIYTILSGALGKDNVNKLDCDRGNIVRMIAGFKAIPDSWINVLASHEYKQASRAYDRMMIKMSKLIEIKKSLTKMASNENYIKDIDDKVYEVYNSCCDEIRRIYRRY